MDKETFDRAYTMFRELKYNRRKFDVISDILPRYFYLVLVARYKFHKGIMESFYALNPGSEKVLTRIWYQSERRYPPKTARQNEISERLRKWRIKHSVKSDNAKPLWTAYSHCKRCNNSLNQERFERFCGICEKCTMEETKG